MTNLTAPGLSGPERLFTQLPLNKLAHGYLFIGSHGVGKRTFARRLAQSVLCEGTKTTLLDFDGTCPSCRMIAANSHPDLLIHEGEMKIGDRDGRDEALTSRELVRALSLHGYGNSHRFVILGEVSFATHHAANALLKFFEEPPTGVHLILTSSTPGKVLGTIRSRLVEVNFPPLSADRLNEILRTAGIAAEIIERVVPAAAGSVSRAKSLIDGAGLREDVAVWFFDALNGQTAESSWATRAQLEEALDIVALLVRDWLVGTVQPDQVYLSGEKLRLRGYLGSSEAALAAHSAFTDARRIATSNVSPALIVDGLRLALAEAGKQAQRARV